MFIAKPKPYYYRRKSVEDWIKTILPRFIAHTSLSYPDLIFYCLDKKIYIEHAPYRNTMWVDFIGLGIDFDQPRHINPEILLNIQNIIIETLHNPNLRVLQSFDTRRVWDLIWLLPSS